MGNRATDNPDNFSSNEAWGRFGAFITVVVERVLVCTSKFVRPSSAYVLYGSDRHFREIICPCSSLWVLYHSWRFQAMIEDQCMSERC